MYNVLTVYELQQLMQELDANHDGKINYNEMTKMMDAECLEPQTHWTRIKSPNSPRPGQGGPEKPKCRGQCRGACRGPRC